MRNPFVANPSEWNRLSFEEQLAWAIEWMNGRPYEVRVARLLQSALDYVVETRSLPVKSPFEWVKCSSPTCYQESRLRHKGHTFFALTYDGGKTWTVSHHFPDTVCITGRSPVRTTHPTQAAAKEEAETLARTL